MYTSTHWGMSRVRHLYLLTLNSSAAGELITDGFGTIVESTQRTGQFDWTWSSISNALSIEVERRVQQCCGIVWSINFLTSSYFIAAGLTLLRVRHLYLLITQHEVVLYYQHHWKVLCWYIHISPFLGKCYFKISEIALHSVWGLY
jgi:hypothetical protein